MGYTVRMSYARGQQAALTKLGLSLGHVGAAMGALTGASGGYIGTKDKDKKLRNALIAGAAGGAAGYGMGALYDKWDAYEDAKINAIVDQMREAGKTITPQTFSNSIFGEPPKLPE